ncbi:hypothetical protein L4D06_25150 [Enterovibrio makurazakiensis]|uniref:hypothetical protein n=1 Tax=Enterovibrio makurazakiensis TaxID=2910232 RepID=UPI003D1FEEDF
MEVIYSPVQTFNFFHELYDIISGRVLIILAFYIFLNFFYGRYLEGKVNKGNFQLPTIFVFAVAMFIPIPNEFQIRKYEYVNYKNLDNYESVIHISGLVQGHHYVDEIWEGNIFEKDKPGQLWRIHYLNIGDEVLIFRELNWKVNQDFYKPRCYRGRFDKLFAPLVGLNVMLGYYKTEVISHLHEKANCLVDIHRV